MADLKITLPEHFLESETRIGYYVAPEMKKIWAVELDLLNEFARVCAKHKLRWFVHAGTLLGAVRHHGFIPWDDDIDVVMPRIDYEKLCNLAEEEFSQPYFLQNEDSDPLFGKVFSKLVNLKTTCLEYSDKDSPAKHCIFIDIFPYDHIPDGDYTRDVFFRKLEKYFKKINSCRHIVQLYTPKTDCSFIKKTKHYIKHLVYKYVLGRRGDYLTYMKKHLDLATKYNFCDTSCVGEVLLPPLGRHVWNKEWVDTVIEMPFEMLHVFVPIGYEKCLEGAFGKDWKVPLQVPSMHSGLVFDIDCAYEDFVKKGLGDVGKANSNSIC